jgi:hypothetical protein
MIKINSRKFQFNLTKAIDKSRKIESKLKSQKLMSLFIVKKFNTKGEKRKTDLLGRSRRTGRVPPVDSVLRESGNICPPQ